MATGFLLLELEHTRSIAIPAALEAALVEAALVEAALVEVALVEAALRTE
jgi:hypothetical protein